MFEPEWLEYFKRESPSAYYSIIFIQFLCVALSYFGYFLLLLFLLSPIFIVYSGVKSIKIKLVKDKKDKQKQHKKNNIEKNSQDLYLKYLDKKIKNKTKK